MGFQRPKQHQGSVDTPEDFQFSIKSIAICKSYGSMISELTEQKATRYHVSTSHSTSGIKHAHGNSGIPRAVETRRSTSKDVKQSKISS